MKAKDTIIPERDRRLIGRNHQEAQAEITWDKAIREVVGTTIYLASANVYISVRELFELHTEGQAKLKEWGIE